MGLNKISVNNDAYDVIVQETGQLTDVAMSQKAVTDIVTLFGDDFTHGTSEYDRTNATKGEVWASAYKVQESGIIKSVYFPIPNVSQKTYYIGVARQGENTENLIVVSSQQVSLSTGDNTLTTPISVQKDDYICVLQPASDAANLLSFKSGTVGGFSSSRQDYNELAVGTRLVPFSGVIDDISLLFTIQTASSTPINQAVEALQEEVETLQEEVETLQHETEFTEEETFTHGADDYNSTATKGQIWASAIKVPKSGDIKSIGLPIPDISQKTYYIGIAKEKTGTTNIKVVRSYPVSLSTGNNVLSTSIPVEKDDYICMLQPISDSDAKAVPLKMGTLGGFASSNQNNDTITIGTLLEPFSGIVADFSLLFTIEKITRTPINEVVEAVQGVISPINDFRGKKLLAIGDSLTDNSGNWVGMLTELLGTISYNRGVSGSYMTVTQRKTNSFCERFDLPASDAATHSAGFPTQADLVLLLGGINDWGGNVNFGDSLAAVDNTTFCGACHYLFRGLKQRYPNARIVIINNYRVYCPNGFSGHSEIQYNNPANENGAFTYAEKQGKTLQQWRDTYCDIASMYGLPIIDLEKVGFSFWKEEDRIAYSFFQNGYYDGLHPSDAGAQKMAEYIAKQLLVL